MTSDELRALREGMTPGPWIYETVRTSCGLCHRIGPFPAPEFMRKESSSACVYDDYPPSGGSPQLVANARAIAAVPDMLDLIEAQAAEIERLQSIASDCAASFISHTQWSGSHDSLPKEIQTALKESPHEE